MNQFLKSQLAYERRQQKAGAFGNDPDFVEQVTRGFYTSSNPFRLKYPLTVGEDANVTVNYNTNQSSEFAKSRLKDAKGIDDLSFEPFVMFDFMEVQPDKKQERIKKMAQTHQFIKNAPNAASGVDLVAASQEDKAANERLGQTIYAILDTTPKGPVGSGGAITNEKSLGEQAEEAHEGGFLTQAKRQFKGSISMYMPTDIQVNDSFAYNENTRKTMGIIEGTLDGDINASASAGSVATSAGAMGGAGFTFGKIFEKFSNGSGTVGKFVASKGGAAAGFIGAAGASIVGDEYQRSSGKASNPHDYMAYQSTALRSFTFTFTFLPDSHKESLEVTRIIKEFRSAAHAKRNDALTLTVPDHVIVSHHGAGDMIQLPPCVIESVNVSYNPNNTSFFLEGNNPVEVGLSVTVKEIVPIYKGDVEAGF